MSWMSGLVVRMRWVSLDIASRLEELGVEEAGALSKAIGEDTEPEEFASTLTWARSLLMAAGGGNDELLSRAEAELDEYEAETSED